MRKGEISFLCFSDGYDGRSPIKKYFITIVDNTGYELSFTVNKSNTENVTCSNIPESKQHFAFEDCNPMNVSVRSQNGIGLSEPTIITIENGKKINIDEELSEYVRCKCSLSK